MTDKDKSYKKMILNHLRRYGSITSLKAQEYYGTTRCSEYIRQLRDEGVPIVTEYRKGRNRWGHKVRYGVYVLCR